MNNMLVGNLYLINRRKWWVVYISVFISSKHYKRNSPEKETKLKRKHG